MKFIIIALSMFILSAQTRAQDTFTFAVVPQQSAKKLAKLWTPLLREISDNSGIKLVFTTAPNIPIFEHRLSQGQYDFAYMNPYHFVVFNESPGYQALAKQKDKHIQGIIVVRKDAPYTSINELNDITMAFPAPAAFAATLLPKADLSAHHVNVKSRYVSSHDSVYLSVARGLSPAGGGILRTFNNAPASVRDQLRILWKTEPHTPHAIASHPDVSSETRQKIQTSLLNLHKTENGSALLEAINFAAFEAADNSDWEDIRVLGIESLK
ncbi:phosphate/phosphite/phosphonate ABC transporter substrate-binding protein [Paraglaciecola sp. L1A13]|uniref:phosphate/phosphite/phosphonate ABC transporter substrate-binding protein n=1 Tax=Paraglaciecola sp. L1A13 TaxID=2686359 RepID=UPI00131E3CD7|nr:phosphate/phosphite/phosphonate ABC transporter substrate-binding protein [Paraglaciecola sp. L1A13]